MIFFLTILFWSVLVGGVLFSAWLWRLAADLRRDPTLRAMDPRDE